MIFILHSLDDYSLIVIAPVNISARQTRHCTPAAARYILCKYYQLVIVLYIGIVLLLNVLSTDDKIRLEFVQLAASQTTLFFQRQEQRPVSLLDFYPSINMHWSFTKALLYNTIFSVALSVASPGLWVSDATAHYRLFQTIGE